MDDKLCLSLIKIRNVLGMTEHGLYGDTAPLAMVPTVWVYVWSSNEAHACALVLPVFSITCAAGIASFRCIIATWSA